MSNFPSNSYCDERRCSHKLFVALTLQKSKSVLLWTVFLSSDRQVVSQVKSLLVKNRNILTHVMLTNLLNVLVNYTFSIKQFVCFPVKSIILSGQIILRKAVQGVIFNNNGLVTILCREFYTVFRFILWKIEQDWNAKIGNRGLRIVLISKMLCDTSYLCIFQRPTI